MYWAPTACQVRAHILGINAARDKMEFSGSSWSFLSVCARTPPHSPISYTPDYHPDSLKARKIYSYKSLGLPDVLVARVLDCILIFGSLTHFFRSPRLPDCNCRTFSFSWDTSRKLGGVLSRGFRIIDSILSTLFYSAWNFVEEWWFIFPWCLANLSI